MQLKLNMNKCLQLILLTTLFLNSQIAMAKNLLPMKGMEAKHCRESYGCVCYSKKALKKIADEFIELKVCRRNLMFAEQAMFDYGRYNGTIPKDENDSFFTPTIVVGSVAVSFGLGFLVGYFVQR